MRKSTSPSQPVVIDAVAVVTTKMFFNILQAARFLGVSPFWIEEMCRQGRLPYRRAGSQRIILRRDLVALMMGLPEERGLVIRRIAEQHLLRIRSVRICDEQVLIFIRREQASVYLAFEADLKTHSRLLGESYRPVRLFARKGCI